MKESDSHGHEPAETVTVRRKKHWKSLKLGDQPLRKAVKHFKHRIPVGP
jgi:hypothetical protein